MPADYENIPLPEDLRLTISRLRELTGNSSDLLISQLTVGGADCALLCCEGMVSSSYIAEEIAEPLSQISGVESSAALLDHIRKYLLLSTDSPTADTFGQLFRLVYSGFAILLANGSSQALAFGAPRRMHASDDAAGLRGSGICLTGSSGARQREQHHGCS